jgi:hypothetical protein
MLHSVVVIFGSNSRCKFWNLIVVLGTETTEVKLSIENPLSDATLIFSRYVKKRGVMVKLCKCCSPLETHTKRENHVSCFENKR